MSFIADVFRKSRTQKNLVISMPKKSRFRGILQKATWYIRPNIVAMSGTAPLPYSLIAVKAIVLQKASVSDMPNLKTFY